MKCQNCQFESERWFDYCPNCGAPINNAYAQPVEKVSINPTADIVLSALKDKAFLIICILMSVAVGIQLLISQFSVINILITIFLWLTYASAQKGIADEKHLQAISGSVYAQYIITNVISIIMIVCGALTSVVMPLALSSDELIEEVAEILSESGISTYNIIEEMYSLTANELEIFGIFLGIAIGVIFVLTGVAMLVLNVLGMKKIHRFIKSVYMGIMYQNPNFDKPRAAKGWLIFFAVCYGLSTLSSAMSGTIIFTVVNGCLTAVAIIAATLIDKYFIPKNYFY